MLLKVLIVVHVLSAVIGVGPTFFMHYIFRKKQSIEELRGALKIAKPLTLFPKMGGTLAVLTGFILLFVGNYGSFMNVWLIGSLVLYIIIQVINIGFVGKLVASLAQDTFSDLLQKGELTTGKQAKLNKIDNLLYVCSTLGTLIFILMILKPAVKIIG